MIAGPSFPVNFEDLHLEVRFREVRLRQPLVVQGVPDLGRRYASGWQPPSGLCARTVLGDLGKQDLGLLEAHFPAPPHLILPGFGGCHQPPPSRKANLGQRPSRANAAGSELWHVGQKCALRPSGARAGRPRKGSGPEIAVTTPSFHHSMVAT